MSLGCGTMWNVSGRINLVRKGDRLSKNVGDFGSLGFCVKPET